jgi:hypothetical protein
MWRTQRVVQHGALVTRSSRVPSPSVYSSSTTTNGASRRSVSLSGELTRSRGVPAFSFRDFSSSVTGEKRSPVANAGTQRHAKRGDVVSPSSVVRQNPKERAQEVFRTVLTSVNSLQQEIDTFPELPPIWSTTTPAMTVEEVEARRTIFVRTREIVTEFEQNVRDGHLRPSGKHRHEVSRLLEKIFQLYSESVSPTPDQSVLDECIRLMDRMLKDWKIELQHKHCEYGVLIAARENRWKEASDIFWTHIDPGDSGYNPCDVSVSNPIGLYAIARSAQEKGVPVVENVFDGVLRMSMVSPLDQDKCKRSEVPGLDRERVTVNLRKEYCISHKICIRSNRYSRGWNSDRPLRRMEAVC